MQKFFFSLLVFLFILLLGSAFALDAKAQAESRTFFIESSYDVFGRKEVEAELAREDERLYFFVEKTWWEERSPQEQNDLRIALFELGQEFKNHIYPVLTSTFGSEPKPGIDKDEKITILFHQMTSDAGGYFRSDDVYEKLQSPGSNEREMIYLNSSYIEKPEAKSFLAHEFTHLITINQKDLLRRVSEDVWLNEARAEYAPTLLGYDDTYEGSNLERRVRDFLSKPTDSLTEWLDRREDYGVVNMFVQYLVDHYGKDILVDSLRSSQVGSASLNEALLDNGFQEDFSQVFKNWTIATLMNECQLGEKYCYKNKNLSSLRITPTSYFIPGGNSVFSAYHTTPHWAANWHRFMGGEQDFDLEFEGTKAVDFEVPYVLCDSNQKCQVRTLVLNNDQRGAIALSDFAGTYSSLTILPFLQGKTSGFEGRDDTFLFSWTVTVQRDQGEDRGEELVRQLLARVAELQEQVRQLQAQLALLRGRESASVVSCAAFETNLSFGAQGEEVRCLQEFLASQGEEVYPEGLVTGNFFALTKQAVIRFQEKYGAEILAPIGEQRGTGYVGQMTRNKINQLLEFSTALAI